MPMSLLLGENPLELYDASFGALSFQHLETARATILRAVRAHGTIRVCQPHEFLFRQHEPAGAFFTLETGKAKIGRIMENGREVILGISYPGDIIGLSEVLIGVPRARFAQMIGDARVWVMHHARLTTLLTSDARLVEAVMRFSAVRFLHAQLSIASLQARRVGARLVQLLIRLAQDSGARCEEGTCITLDFTREEMASMVGATRQSICTLLGTLSQRDLIRIEGRRVMVRSWEALIVWATEE